jgi:hypothetical protein
LKKNNEGFSLKDAALSRARSFNCFRTAAAVL